MFGRLGLLCLAGMWLCAAPLMAATSQNDSLVKDLSQVASGLNPQALSDAVAAMQCAVNHGAQPARRLAVIDYSQPSTAKRLWIFDLQTKRLLLRDYVAHGRLSGENFASQFSNRLGSFQTSLGLYRTAESYRGKHGYSLRMDGLEPGLNDLARERAIVIHGASYVNPSLVRSQGRIGRSLGCPAVRPEVARMVVDKLKGGQFLLAWHSDPRWLSRSALLACKSPRLAQTTQRLLAKKS
ncbi:murein L,D-transpeptidase catalytic domain family protein [Pseudomonas sp. BMS12]|uniref:murein L,D-transpeptidase catalytic domain family protein n=1 Tax=Pseudomonas sp. BMS12 TaxID=1796033 RepID=UPI000839DECD|nr:murein L,D-transpeptidase catalytic domain family protein [Pseudomonas sp. BMS12]